MSVLTQNATVLTQEYNWFSHVLRTRIDLHLRSKPEEIAFIHQPPPFSKGDDTSRGYMEVVEKHGLLPEERLVILLALAPAVYPSVLDILMMSNPNTNRPFSEFGGVKGQHHIGFLPTIETAYFLLAGKNLMKRFQYTTLFEADAALRRLGILQIDAPQRHEPKWSAGIRISEEYINLFTTGQPYRPDFNSNFPADRLTTLMEWDDLILESTVMREVQEIADWLTHEDMILHEWGMAKRIKPGFRALFYGPPGTGKTLTATLIGKSLGVDVYRIDLSQVVSKYIGETEKNLANIFNQAENKNWILFFDEADALFGKRTETNNARDRHANQEVAYLLQRIEAFPGIIILASNLKGNIDDAFARRFQSMIHFPIPNPSQRLRLWQTVFPAQLTLSENINFRAIAEKYKITGGSIINVARYCALTAARRKDNLIRMDDINVGIRREFSKEGKV